MTPSPGTVREVIDVGIKRPRPEEIKSDESFIRCRSRIWQLLQNQCCRTQEEITESGRKVLRTLPQDAVI
jgi:ABC-type nitrate/sulfonate/bicarbonate transport system ATPase subunit